MDHAHLGPWRAVCDARYTFATAVDDRDWDLLRSVLADPVRVDYSSWSGRPAATMPAPDWIARCRSLFEGLDATQHSLSNPRIEIQGDEARSSMYVVAEHFLDGRRFSLGGSYTDVLIRVDGRWRLRDMTLTVRWRHGDAAIIALARDRTAHRR